MANLTVGIDVSQDTLDVSVGTPETGVRFLGTFANDPERFDELAAALRQELEARGSTAIHLVMEPTGGYELPLARFALKQNWQVSLPNPRQVHDWAKGQGRRSKTDRQDSMMLTGYGMSTNPPTWQPLPEAVAELDALLERRVDLKSMLRQELNRRHALEAQRAYQGPVAKSIDQAITWLENALAEIEKAIRQHMDDHPDLKQEAQRLRTVPGVGERNVLDILVFLHRYAVLSNNQGTGKGATAQAGLDPVHRQSGTSLHKRSLISRQGDKRIRSTLFMGAFGGVHGNNPLRAFYQNLVQRGKLKRVALVAAARKLLVWAWAVFQGQGEFDPQRAQARHVATA